jgi:hypothetical protein
MRNIELFCERSWVNSQIEIYGKIGENQIVATLTSLPLSIGQSAVLSPILSINMTSAQQLIDELWRCGLRPSEGSGSAGALSATQKHLEGMRALVFDTPAKVIVDKRPI